MPLPISTFWPIFEIVGLNGGTKNIIFAIWVSEIEEFDITVADYVWEIIQ